MAVGHEEIMAADLGSPGMLRAAMDGDMLAEDVGVADFQRGGLILIFEMLRRVAQDGAAVHDIAAPQRHRAIKHGPRPESALGADLHRALDDAIRADFYPISQFRFTRND